MKQILKQLHLWLPLVALLSAPSIAQKSVSSSDDRPALIADRTVGMTHLPGLLPLHWDVKKGRLYLEIPRLGEDLLYVDSLPYGIGSNEIGLDRGQMGEPKIVHFERYGPKILLVERNESFRSSATDAAERLAVAQSFPESVLAAFAVVAEERHDAAGAVLIDATDFFLRDAHRYRRIADAQPPGGLQARRRPFGHRVRRSPRVSEERRSRVDADVRRRIAGEK
jgi:hypothetical protein